MMRRPGETGFTLIELLVALAIFAMLAAGGVMLLSGSVSAQGAIKHRLDDMAAVQRTGAVLAGDLGQAAPRITRLENGMLAPAFFANPGSEDRPILQFVRAGWSNLAGEPRPSLQKVEYWLRAGRLERRSFAQLDGAVGDPAVPLLEGIDSATLRFRDAGGQWLEVWTPTQPDLLPRAVEMNLARKGQPPLLLRFLVAPGPLAKPEGMEAAGG